MELVYPYVRQRMQYGREEFAANGAWVLVFKLAKGASENDRTSTTADATEPVVFADMFAVLREEAHQYRVLALGSGTQRLAAGRAKDCQLCIQHKSVSKLHAIVEQNGDGIFVSDQGSRNGTWLNGKKLEPKQKAKVASGDRIQLGTVAVYCFGPPAFYDFLTTLLDPRAARAD
jgi:hypothetical protein